MGRLSNALMMLNYLMSSNRIKIKELSEVLAVKERMIRKYKDELVSAGFEITSTSGRNGGYKLENGHLINYMNLTEEEIHLVVKIINSYNDDSRFFSSEEDLKFVVSKLKSSINEVNHVSVPGSFLDEFARPNVDMVDEKDKYDKIQDAIRNKMKISISYYSTSSGKSERVVWPLKNLYRKGFWYLEAYCENRNKILTFKNCRVSSLMVLDDRYIIDNIEKDEIKRAGSLGLSAGKQYEVKLKVEFPMSMIIQERIWTHDQKITKSEKDNSILFEGTITGYPELKRWILGMGSKVLVLEPDSLKVDIDNEIVKMANRYGKL